MPEIVIPYKANRVQDTIHTMARQYRFLAAAHRGAGTSLAAVKEALDAALCTPTEAPGAAHVGPYRNPTKLRAWDYLKRLAGVSPGLDVNATDRRADGAHNGGPACSGRRGRVRPPARCPPGHARAGRAGVATAHRGARAPAPDARRAPGGLREERDRCGQTQSLLPDVRGRREWASRPGGPRLQPRHQARGAVRSRIYPGADGADRGQPLRHAPGAGPRGRPPRPCGTHAGRGRPDRR